MSFQYLASIKIQLYNFVSNSKLIKYPFTVSSTIFKGQQSFLELIKQESPNNAALIAFSLLPIYKCLPNVIIHELISMLTPQNRIELSHTCRYFRELIISSRCLSDLWLYIYHIPLPKQQTQIQSKTSSFLPYMIFNSSNSEPATIGPSHATSLPNTMATSCDQSMNNLFKSSNSSSTDCINSECIPSLTPPKIKNIKKIEHIYTVSPNRGINNLNYSSQDKCIPYMKLPTSSFDDQPIEEQPKNDNNNAIYEDKVYTNSLSPSTDPLLDHPLNPILTSKIVYWPNYKQVLSCDFPLHWRRKNTFYNNLCLLSKYCGGAHVRVYEVGLDRLFQILSRISPMLLVLSFLNMHSVSINAYYFRCQNRLSYLAYQYIDGESTIFIPQNIVALELTSCTFTSKSFYTTISCDGGTDRSLPNIKYLQISNCRFSNLCLQNLFDSCPNILHLSITTTSWYNEIIQFPSSLLSIIWKHNEGEFIINYCNNLWEAALTISDISLIKELGSNKSLKQLCISTPLFKEMNFLNDLEKPFSFYHAHAQTTPYFNSKSPSIRSISHISLSPSLPTLSYRLNKLTFSPSSFSTNTNNTIKKNECKFQSLNDCVKSKSNLSNLSLDSDDDDDDNNNNNKNTNNIPLKIVCYGELTKNEWFTNKFIGDNIKFTSNRLKNPLLQKDFNKLNPIFVREMKQTTHMFFIPFPFF